MLLPKSRRGQTTRRPICGGKACGFHTRLGGDRLSTAAAAVTPAVHSSGSPPPSSSSPYYVGSQGTASSRASPSLALISLESMGKPLLARFVCTLKVNFPSGWTRPT